MVLTEDQLDALILWYDRTVYAGDLVVLFTHEQYFHDNGLIEIVYDIIGAATLTKGFILSKKAKNIAKGAPTLTKGFILSKKAKEIVKRREPLRLTLELMSRIGGSLSVADMADIVKRIPFAELPELLACDDIYIRELAERKWRKREFFASMR